jgi:alanyl-tRNA synthetase
VAPDRFRFDFTHFAAPSDEELRRIEDMANRKVMENHPVRNYETSLATARELGVTALFGEKYGDIVRVLEVGNFSKELCGGTHVARSSEINLIKFVSEGSVGANLRRIEAVTSFDALDYVERVEGELLETASELKVNKFDVAERAGTLVTRMKELEVAVKRGKSQLATADVEGFLAEVKDVGYPLLVTRVPDLSVTGLREVSDVVRARLGGGAVVLATADPDSGAPLLLAAGGAPAVAAGFNANLVIKAMAPHIKGGGGGKPEMAQAGGKDPSKLAEALDQVPVYIKTNLK